MEKVSVLVYVSQEAAIMAGKSEYGQALVEIDPAKLSQEQREVLADSPSSRNEGDGRLYLYPQLLLQPDCPKIGYASEEVVISILDALVERRMAAREKAKKQHEADVQFFLSAPIDQVVSKRQSFKVDGQRYIAPVADETAWWELCKLSDSVAVDARCQARIAEINAEIENHNRRALELAREEINRREAEIREKAAQIVAAGVDNLLGYKQKAPAGERWTALVYAGGTGRETWLERGFDDVANLLDEASAEAERRNGADLEALMVFWPSGSKNNGTENQEKASRPGPPS